MVVTATRSGCDHHGRVKRTARLSCLAATARWHGNGGGAPAHHVAGGMLGPFFQQRTWAHHHRVQPHDRERKRVVLVFDNLAEELEALGGRLLLARDVGQVRDVLRTSQGRTELRRVYPTVRAAVDAARTGT